MTDALAPASQGERLNHTGDEPYLIERRLAAQAGVFKICASNANQHCKGVVGEVHILQCLIKTERIDSAKCTQAITDAGWR